MAHLIGRDFTPPDIHAKVTGRAKYAEDIRADGMLFCRLLTSPMPHARVLDIDASEALAMEGVVAILTADELPDVAEPGNTILTNEPLYVGAPILAVAAVDETTAPERHRGHRSGSGTASVLRGSAREPASGRPERQDNGKYAAGGARPWRRPTPARAWERSSGPQKTSRPRARARCPWAGP